MSQNQSGFPGLPRGAHPDLVVDQLNRQMVGRLNVNLAIKLNSSTTTTIVSDSRIGATSGLLLTPLSSHSAQQLTGTWVSSRQKGSATFTHASTTFTDLSFNVTILG